MEEGEWPQRHSVRKKSLQKCEDRVAQTGVVMCRARNHSSTFRDRIWMKNAVQRDPDGAFMPVANQANR
jgi:hypothetical protein